jgi:hypothetical protein
MSSLAAVWTQTRFRPRYLLLLSFPLAGLLSMGLHDVSRRARLAWARPRRKWSPLALAAVVVLCLGLGSVGAVRSALAQTCCESHPAEEEAVATLRSTCTPGGYAISDDGMISFRAGLLTPPELAVISYRRLRTGQLTAETLVAASQEYRPQAVIFWDKRLVDVPGHFPGLPEYVDWVNQHYCLTKAWSSSQRIYGACDMLQHSGDLLVQLDDFARIVGWSLGVPGTGDGVASPGETLLLTSRWQTLHPTDADYHIFCHLGQETPVAQWDGRPRWGEHPTYRWAQGEEVIDSYPLDVPLDTPPGYYPLWVGMYDSANGVRLTISDAQGQHIGSEVLLTHVRVGRPEFDIPTISQPQEASLGGQVRLLGYDLFLEEARAGDLVHLTLYWQCLKEMDISYTVFVHILDAQGNMVGQWDSVPQSRKLPTTTWVPGEVVVDSYEVPVALEEAVGSCTVEVGMYDPNTGRRLPVVDGAGVPQEDDRVLLGVPIDAVPIGAM